MTRTKPPSVERSSRSRRSASLTRRPAAYSSSSSARPDAAGVVGLVRVVAAGGLEQPLGLLDGQRLGQEPWLAGQVEVGGDVDADQALAVGEPVEALEGGGAAAKAATARGPGRRGRPRRVRAAR